MSTKAKQVSGLLMRLGGVYRDPQRVERDANQVLHSSVGGHLVPKLTPLAESDGSMLNTLCLQGTIAIHYRGQTYQQLLDIYLPSGYPIRCPVCFVRLAPGMYIKSDHPHVASDGKVYMPYLSQWRPNTHNLVELVVNMSSTFSALPPVFAHTPATQPPPVNPPPVYNVASVSVTPSTTPPPISAQTNAGQELDPATAEEILRAEAEEANRVAEAARRAAQEEDRQRKAQEEWDAKNLASTKERVRRKVYAQLQEESKEAKSIIEEDMQDQARLERSRLDEKIKALEMQKRSLEGQLETVQEKTESILEWLEDAAESSAKQETKSIDDYVVPVQPVHQQMLDLSVENASLTDALYFLDRALHKQTIDLSTHLRQVRKLSKRQFLARAHLVKIAQTMASGNT